MSIAIGLLMKVLSCSLSGINVVYVVSSIDTFEANVFLDTFYL